MNLYISVDLEGISGVVHGDFLGSNGNDYDRGRKLMTGEVNAAVEGALDAGADEIVVNDGHGGMRNVLIEDLNSNARLLTGAPKVLGQMEGIETAADFDGVLFVGYHARAKSAGVLNHTISGRVVSKVYMNGMEVGEAGLNAAVAGQLGIPVVFCSGDSVTCHQVEKLLSNVVTTEVKEDAGRYAALCLTPEKARAAIKEGVKEAVMQLEKGQMTPLVVDGPVRFELEVADTAMADLACLLPGAERVGSTELEVTAENPLQGYKSLRAMIYLASASRR